jgi:hypothetical protein
MHHNTRLQCLCTRTTSPAKGRHTVQCAYAQPVVCCNESNQQVMSLLAVCTRFLHVSSPTTTVWYNLYLKRTRQQASKHN